MDELTVIAERFREIAETLNAPDQARLVRTKPMHDGSRHCEYNGDFYTLTTSERGKLFDQQTTCDPNELLFWLVRDMTAAMAVEYVLSNRQNGLDGDTRAGWFDHHVELLQLIDHTWAEKQRLEYDRILADNTNNGG